jgi:hypothetical protein
MVEQVAGARGTHLMRVRLDLKSEEHLDVLRTFGPYSIHAEVYLADEPDYVLSMHDSGTSVVFKWDPEAIAELVIRARVPGDALQPVRARRHRLGTRAF